MVAADAETLLHRALLGEASECAAAAIFVWNEDRHYVAVNDAACELVGLTRAELIGMPVGGMTEAGAARELEQVRSESPARGSSSFTRRDGERVDLEWLTMRTRVAGLPNMLSICWRAS
jgi:PAS domain S-box-containing protein